MEKIPCYDVDSRILGCNTSSRGLLAVQGTFKDWSISEIMNSRRTCQSLHDLILSMKYTEKSRNNMLFTNLFKHFSKMHALDSKRRAISLCASIPLPQTIFSYYNSCAFTVQGQGEFEVDVTIDVDDLSAAGYYFGVNYYGHPVVEDAKGDIRKIYFDTFMVEDCMPKSITVRGYHPLQTNKMFDSNTKNRTVGMNRMIKASIITRIFKIFRRRDFVDSYV